MPRYSHVFAPRMLHENVARANNKTNDLLFGESIRLRERHTGVLTLGISLNKNVIRYVFRPGRIRSGQVESGQLTGQARSGQVRSGQVRPGQVRSGQIRSGNVVSIKFP